MNKTLSNIAFDPVNKQFGIILWENEPFEAHLPASLKIRGKGIWAKNDVQILTKEQAAKLLQYEERLEDIENPWLEATDKCIKYIGGLDETQDNDNTLVAQES